ncbi:MAG: hypothetical protein J6D87_05250 [Clostridia bacterium]|nr:hypothetical protein [Clostridia bacterium]MBQ7315731.1 hypothetical protein [Clostridia bacterium]
MKYSERLHTTATSHATYAQDSTSERSFYIQESQYIIGGVQTFCWLVRTDSLPATFSVMMYSAPCGLMDIRLFDEETAKEVFHLFTKYEVSPYHAEDIIEDREIRASIRFL